MVDLVEVWEEFEDAADRCHYGAYQVSDVGDNVEVRVMAGRFGFIGTFPSRENEQFKVIMSYCKSAGFIKIRGSIPTEFFFTLARQ